MSTFSASAGTVPIPSSRESPARYTNVLNVVPD